MDDNSLLFDSFNIYYEKGIDALRDKNYEVAKRNILSAAETLLKMAKKSTGALKAKRIKRAEELYQLANDIETKQKNGFDLTPNNASKDLQTVIQNQPNIKDPSAKLDDDAATFVPEAKTNITLSDVAGLSEAKDAIKRLVIEPMLHPDVYAKFKRSSGGGILLYGVPGTGKTMLAQALANEIKASFYSIKCSDIVSKWFGQAEKNVKSLFEEARKNPCSIIFFDEFEALGAKRDTDSTVMRRLVPELLSQMQGFNQSKNTLLLIAATNRPWDIDSAFLRPGRFNTRIYVPLPDDDARRVIIGKNLEGIPKSAEFDEERIVKQTEGFNGSDVVEFCEALKDSPIKRTIELGHDSPLTNDDIDSTSKRVHSSVRKEDLEKIYKFESGISK